MIGKILGDRYELIEKIGEGGMAEVYKAKCHKLNRFNAIKILKKEFSTNQEIVDRFKREATAIANLNDNNIIGVLDVGTQDGINYIVMEYVKGKTLKEIIRQNGRLSPKETIDISIQISKALDCAHRNNIIHRDIKPQNILITQDGTVKVTDFGIAKSVSSATMTHTTAVMGSAHYFSPEQAKGSYLDERTDIYSLGIVMYEMITGKLPFDADNPVSIALMHIQDPVKEPRAYDETIPENLNALILKAMEKEPIKRYQSSKELLYDLIKIKNNENFNIVKKTFDEDYTRVMAPVTAKGKPSHTLEEDEEDLDEEPKSKKKTIILLALLGVLVLGLGVMAAYLISGNGVKNKDVVIPSIVGKTVEEAQAMVKDLELTLNIEKVESSEKENTIISSSPEVGTTVKRNTAVAVKVSGGESKSPVPNVVELDITRANSMLTLAGFEVGETTYEYHDTIQKNYVISQNPLKDTQLVKGSKINLVVSLGKEIKNEPVPDLYGRSSDEAKSLLEAKNLVLGKVSEGETTDKSLEGKVISQSIPKGTSVEVGTKIDITIGKYKAKTVNLQSFLGADISDSKTKNQLESIAKEYNLKYTYEGITDKNPPKGATIESISPEVPKEGDTVTIELSVEE